MKINACTGAIMRVVTATEQSYGYKGTEQLTFYNYLLSCSLRPQAGLERMP